MSSFKKILIANRGEIALRIMKSCQKLGIPTVAVYSEADKEAPFVKQADEAYLIGPPPVSKSYLNVDKILEVAKDAGADAIHPGYGFLAENAGFAERCLKEKISFIGPSSEIIRMMGDKISARQKMKEAGVPIVPGVESALSSLAEASKAAAEIGYPVMLKASAGGGGIGMQVVNNEEELSKAFASTARKATNFFGDGTLFLEKFIQSPRHIEVQIIADNNGEVRHLWERECSIQRRNQKIVEEAPSPFLNEVQRHQLCQAAVQGAAAIGYNSLGTMEFIFDSSGNFYFLEMNTRIQVEHPVTEEITGFDLVEWQIRLAEGAKLDLKQEDILKEGHAIECRVYAEDPETFMPSPGLIEELSLPEDIRLDFAVEKGNKVTPFYDPMIGKMIIKAATREEAIEKTKIALDSTIIEGIKCNIAFLQLLVDSSAFQSGQYDTKYVENLLKKGQQA